MLPYREPGSLPAHSENYLASILRLPQLVLPGEKHYSLKKTDPCRRQPLTTKLVGQVPYDSRASGRKEYHPITASLIGAEGTILHSHSACSSERTN